MRIHLSLAFLLFAVPAVVCAQTSARPSAKTTPKAQIADQIHRSALVIDTHAGTPQRLVDEHFDLGDPLGGGNLNLASIRKGNLGAEFFSIWVDPARYEGQYARRTLELIDSVKQQVIKHPKELMFVATPGGIELARRERKLAVLMGIEGGHSIENSIPLLRQYYSLGVRYMTLTSSNSNDWADSSGDIDDKSIPHTKEGLTEFGKDVVYEMNRLGMMVDISHVSDKTFYETLRISRAPVIASDSSARALCDAPRNMTDDMLRAVANYGGPGSKGGVVEVSFYSGFISQAWRNAAKARQPELDKAVQALKDQAKAAGKPIPYAEIEKLDRQFANRIPRPPLSALIDHIDHIVKVAGIDHVGLGTDFDGVNGQLPEGIDSAADLPRITEALMERGYSAEDCRKILGGNLMRVFREVEQIAHTLQAENRPKITEKQPFDKPAK
ncbi:MAG: dipeptidase [Terracidiphilus sp.]|jgi:membrane dipeptidase